MSTISLKWTDAAVRTDGTPGAPVTVDLFQAPDAVTPIGTVAGGVQAFTTKDLPPGTYSFMAVQTDAAGVKSAPSNTVTITLPAVAAPALVAIADLSATINP